MEGITTGVANRGVAIGLLMARTDGRTNGRATHLNKTSSVLNAHDKNPIHSSHQTEKSTA